MKTGKLFNKDFLLMVIGQIISLFGNVALRFALSLYVLDKTGSAAIFASILAVSIIPTILLSPLGGVLADRVSRKHIMVVLDFLTASTITIFALLVSSDAIIVIISIVMVLLAIIQCFYQPSVQSSIPLLVAEDNLLKANGVVVQVNAVSNLLGPILGGVLYGFFGLMPILICSAICFFVSAVMEIFIHIPFEKIKAKGNVIATVCHDLKVGLHVVMAEDKILFKALLTIALINFCVSSFFSVGLPYIVKVFLGLSSLHYGFVQSAVGVGTILGGISVGLLAKKMKTTKLYLCLIFTCLLLLPIAFAIITNTSPLVSYSVIIISILGAMFCCSIYNIFIQTLLQQMTPNHLLGKVSSFVTTIVLCCFPIGQSLYGFLFDALPDKVFIITILTAIVGILVALLTKKMFSWFDKHSPEEFKQKIEQKNWE